MMGKNHLMFSACGFLALATTAPETVGAHPFTTGQLAAGTLLAAGATMIPDLDLPQATVSRSLGPVTETMSRVIHTLAGGHRKGTHTVYAWLGFTLLAAWALSLSHGPLIELIFAIFCSSLLVRVLTEAKGAICLALAAILGGSAVLAAGPSHGWAISAICIGYIFHMLGDMITTEGIPPFYPLGGNIALPIIGSTDHWREKTAGSLSGLVALYLLVTAVFLPAWNPHQPTTTPVTSKSSQEIRILQEKVISLENKVKPTITKHL